MLTFLHTSPVHVATFDRLLAETGNADIPTRHVIDETLLAEARAAGGVTPAIARRVRTALEEAHAQGAEVALCTCSTIGDCAERLSGRIGSQDDGRMLSVIRVDRPMAERAVALGRRITLVAALASTLAPTRELLLDAAQTTGQRIEITEYLCAEAWTRFEAGDLTGYLEVIAEQLQTIDTASTDVIVLAQASMAGAAALCPNTADSLPLLSSPAIGLEAAVQAYRRTANTLR